MTKVNWEKLQLKFWFEHSQTGISAKGWCNKYQLNYATARRYIKVRTVKESVVLQVESNPMVKARATPKRRGPPYGSQNALKHGGYSKYFYNDLEEIMEAITKDDELLLCRVRIHYVLFYMVQLQQKLEKKPSDEITVNLFKYLFLADLAIDKNMARIEAITKKASSRRLDDLGKT
jgi:uncharacterized protein YjcR